MKRNTKPMENYNRKRGEETRERVLKAIDFYKEKGEISVTLVCQKAHISRTYFTNHPDVRKVLDDAIGITNRKLKKRMQSQDSKDALNKALYTQIKKMQKQIEQYQKEESYKEKYKNERAKNESLKKKLDEANLQNGLLNF